MGKNSLVSIIIPVYNAERYLKECIDNILNQTHEYIELILINDGSTDNSRLICDEYAKNDHRIRVIHQENSGPSVARNKGINIAKGNFIQFIDADDSIEKYMTSKLVEAMNDKGQLVICGYKIIEIYNDKKITRNKISHIKGSYHSNEFLEYFGELFKDNLINPLWNKLYVTDVIKNFDIKFVKEINMGEDLLFNLQYIKACNTIKLIDEPLYNYIKYENSNSLTGSFKKNFFENQQILFKATREFLLDNDSYKEKNKDSIEIAFTNSIISCFNNFIHKDSCLTKSYIIEQITKIIFHKEVRRNINYFKEGSIQKKIIGYCIENKSTNGIYYFLKMKSILRNNNMFFNRLKSVINK